MSDQNDGRLATLSRGTLFFSSIGVIGGAGYALGTRKSPWLYGAATGVGHAIGAVTFFGFREYLVAPLIGSSGLPFSTFGQTNDRSRNILESAIAGTLTGGTLSLIMSRSPRLVLTGAGAWGVIAPVLQFAYNEASIRRDISHSAQVEREALSSGTEEPKNASEKIMEVMTWVAPVKKISDQEYLDLMKKQQDAVEKRLDEVQPDGAVPRTKDDRTGAS
ncbi:hypothetical protein FRB94_001531 [Tulasnella sp. JGI-2019a]|nr:hypothetical protein FRB93_012496 [Tulasnella sp. JGI-2019a]KAG9005446.1 hypothetical protein FRB94_001531 [Tulasnella sp. JGI-2019a]KAG9025337.1 hypothetical protein FRB95_010260 [Tulasnella sp. JGI-2019a]